MQGGTGELRPEDAGNLESLGSLFVEPIWLFYRDDAARRVSASGRLTSLAQCADCG